MLDPILIQTKLHRPQLPQQLILRPRLLEQLDRGFKNGFILVSAAAGFGKSTMVSSWIEELSRGNRTVAASLPATWLTLNSSDSELNIFLQYFIAALRILYPEACAETLEMIQAPNTQPESIICASLINEIDSLPGDFILVLDDYYTIRSEAVHNILNELLQYKPRPLHLIVISRKNPPFSLESLRVKYNITEIRSRDLRFTSEEIDEYLRLTLPQSLKPEILETLQAQSEGWIAGLQLASLSLRATDEVETILANLADADVDITRYLVDEVLAQQPEPIQKFLILTSIFDVFWVDLCQAIIGSQNPECKIEYCLNWIIDANLFVISVTDRKGYYRYHNLFRDMLQQYLFFEIGKDGVIQLHLRIANWLANQGLVEEAINHALKAQDLDLAASLMENALCEVLNREDFLTLEHWLHLMPDDYIEQKSTLLMIKIWTYEFSWQLGLIQKNIQKLQGLLEGNELRTENQSYPQHKDIQQNIKGQVLCLLAQANFHTNQISECILNCQEALTLLPEEWKYVRGGTVVYLGVGMQAAGQGDAAERFLLEQYESQVDKTDNFSLRLLFALCFIYFLSGKLDQTHHTALALLFQTKSRRLTIMIGWAQYFLARVYYHWNKLNLAQEQLEEMMSNRYIIQPLAAKEAMAALARIQMVEHHSVAAWRTMQTLSNFDMERFGIETDETRSLRAHLFLLEGNLVEACRWAEAYTTLPSPQPLIWLQDPQITKVQILFSRGDPMDLKLALHILGELDQIAKDTNNLYKLVNIHAFRSVILDAQGKTTESEDALNQAIDFSRSGDFVRIFVDIGIRMKSLLTRIAPGSIYSETIDHILAAFPVNDGSQNPAKPEINNLEKQNRIRVPITDSPDHLTGRELEILTLMQEPLSAKQIAQRLGISPLTVKRHMINLYSKLGVNRRWDAIVEARRLGILYS